MEPFEIQPQLCLPTALVRRDLRAFVDFSLPQASDMPDVY